MVLFYFSKKIGSDSSCKLSAQETICMQWQCLFSEKKKKINLSSVEYVLRMVSVKPLIQNKNFSSHAIIFVEQYFILRLRDTILGPWDIVLKLGYYHEVTICYLEGIKTLSRDRSIVSTGHKILSWGLKIVSWGLYYISSGKKTLSRCLNVWYICYETSSCGNEI